MLTPYVANAQSSGGPKGAPTSGSTTSSGESGATPDPTDLALWLFRDDGLQEETRRSFREALERALADTRRRHLLSQESLERYLEGRSAPIPDCLEGLRRCISPHTLVFDQLGLSSLVRVEVQRRENGNLSARYRLVDRRGESGEEAEVDAPGPEKLAFALVRALFDATGNVRFQSEPPGATVHVDGEALGTAPLEARLPVGEHSYEMRHTGRRAVEGAFDVTSGTNQQISKTLPKKPGRLVIENAPEGAEVYVDGTQKGSAGTPLELEPGSYEIAVRAEGFESHRETVEVESGETLRRSVPLSSSSSLLRDIPADQIAVNHYIARLSYDHAIHGTSFRDARGEAGGREYEFQSFATDAGERPGEGIVKRTLAPFGLRMDFAYTGRNFGVVLMSLSYTAARTDKRAFVEQTGGDGGTIAGTVTGLRRLQLRPLQVSYRHFFKNFVPAVELGTGMTFQWLDIEDLPGGADLTLHQTEAFWNLGFAGQYFFNQHWFALARYSLQDYFNAGKGVEHVISLGVGAAYPNVFGFEPEPPEEL